MAAAAVEPELDVVELEVELDVVELEVELEVEVGPADELVPVGEELEAVVLEEVVGAVVVGSGISTQSATTKPTGTPLIGSVQLSSHVKVNGGGKGEPTPHSPGH